MAGIEEQLDRVERNVADALTATAEMGASVPATANSDNLGTLIRSIPRSGGGATSWNDLTDKPFYSEMGIVEILPETTIELDPEYGEGFGLDIFDVQAGTTCIVKWNGTEYNCVAQPFDMEGIPAVVLGNLGAMTGGDLTGEPFVLMFLDAEAAAMLGAGFGVYALDGSESVTLSISAESEVVHKMDEKYLPSYAVLYVEEIANGYLYKTADTSDENNRITSAELKSLWLGGRKFFVCAPMIDGSGNFMGYYWLNSFVLMDYGVFCQLIYENKIAFYPAEYEG